MGAFAWSERLSVAMKSIGRCNMAGAKRAFDKSDAIRKIYCARALRDFGDAFVAVLLPVYLTSLGFSPLQVGIIATLALFGSALLTLVIGLVGSRYEHRRLLLVMAATGVAFALVNEFALLAVVAFAGTVNPSAGSLSVFVPLEHAVLSREVIDHERTQMFARYSLIGAMAGTCGALAAAAPDFLAVTGLGHSMASRLCSYFIAGLGMIGGWVYSRIPARPPPADGDAPAVLGPSRYIVYRLAVLFCLDALAGGFLVQSLLALWMFERFDLSLSAAGLFFFWSGVLAAFSFPVAAWLALAPHRPRQHDGVHAHPIEPVLDDSRYRPELISRARLAAPSRRPLANGCTDPLVLCHSGRDGGRARRGREFHVPTTQFGCGGQSGTGRRTFRGVVSRFATHHLWRSQDRLRRSAVAPVPALEATGGTGSSITPAVSPRADDAPALGQCLSPGHGRAQHN
jgi:MFS family permease